LAAFHRKKRPVSLSENNKDSSNNKLMEFHAAISSSGKAEEGDMHGAVWRPTATRPDGERASEKHQDIV
jgi:hypothetical protein